MSLIIAGERSGVGKTTITLSILAFLARQRKKIVQGFKVGPDYIDPMFHTAVTGRYCRNLDPILTSPDYVRSCFALHSSSAHYAVIEGVMGLFDGVPLHSTVDYASTAHVARILNLPVLLVLDCSRLSGSIAAIAHGYKTLDPRVNVAGVVLNRVASDRHLQLLEDALVNIKMPILGVVRRHDSISIPDRHLGLIPASELPEITKVFARLAHIAKTSLDWKRLLPLLCSTKNYQSLTNVHKSFVLRETKRITTDKSLRIAIASDRAFNFYYQDNLDILRQLGAELVFWSPLSDLSIPSEVAGFYFGGGFPEIFARELAENQLVKRQLRQFISQDIPVYAECGGLMYLCDRLIDLNGKTWNMVGSIPTTAKMTSRLTLGYRQAFPINSSSLISVLQKREKYRSYHLPIPPSPHVFWGHEFHRSQLTDDCARPLWYIKGWHSQAKKVAEGWKINHIHASYLHLHCGKSEFLFKNWLNSCLNYKNQLG